MSFRCKRHQAHLGITQEGIRHPWVSDVMDDGSQQHRSQLDRSEMLLEAVGREQRNHGLRDVGRVRAVVVRVVPAPARASLQPRAEREREGDRESAKRGAPGNGET